MDDGREIPSVAWWAGERVRLSLLCGCLGVLVVCLLATRTNVLRSSGRSASACPIGSAPRVLSVTAADLSGLRASVARAMPRRIGRLYEEGTIESGNAWSDDSPSPPPAALTALRPAGYEMRWWAPNRDDVVADVFLFAGARQAQRFLEEADSTRCRSAARRAATSWPAQAHNLRWVNPDGFAQADVLFARGRRVYRVAEVPAGERGVKPSRVSLRQAFLTVDGLACLLPDAGCAIARLSVPA